MTHGRRTALIALLVVPLVAVAGLIVMTWRHGPVASKQTGKLRIVSLAPSVTEMVFALGAGGELVGATEYCDYPPEAKGIERVGGLGTPNMEKLLSLLPDVVIATQFQRSDDAQALRQAGVQVLELKINNFEEMFQATQQIGRAIGRSQRAEQVVAALRADLEAAGPPSGDRPRESRPKVFVEIWNHPLRTEGRESFLTDMIWRAGGVNVAGDLSDAYPLISPEKVIEWDPDVIILSYMGRQSEHAAEVAGRIGWSEISAVKTGRIITDIPADFLLRPGPRLIEGVKILSRRLHQTGDPKRPDVRRDLGTPPATPPEAASQP